MVERLAARLQQSPDDANGWIQLGRSYMVLNQPQKAVEAFTRELANLLGRPAINLDTPELQRAGWESRDERAQELYRR